MSFLMRTYFCYTDYRVPRSPMSEFRLRFDIPVYSQFAIPDVASANVSALRAGLSAFPAVV